MLDLTPVKGEWFFKGTLSKKEKLIDIGLCLVFLRIGFCLLSGRFFHLVGIGLWIGLIIYQSTSDTNIIGSSLVL